MKTYTISYADDPMPLDGRIDGAPWADADMAAIDEFPWYERGEKQSARVRALYDDDAVYLQYQVEDAYSYAEATELNGPVWEDSAIEFFARPDLDDPNHFNFEANCVSTFLIGWGYRRERVFIEPGLAEPFQVETSIGGPTKEESPDDDAWWLAARLPFDAISEFIGLDVRPSPGTEWRGNFHRCGGKTDPQAACWNPYGTPERDYHNPDYFGRLIFD